MELRQHTEQRQLLVPELRQSLKILSLPVIELRDTVQEELSDNPFLEASQSTYTHRNPSTFSFSGNSSLYLNLLANKTSLQEILLRQLEMFVDDDESLTAGKEIIGNIDESGYLKCSIEEMAKSLNINADKIEKTLKLIQRFEPPGIAARTISECLLLQLEAVNNPNPLARKIVEHHLTDIAKKNYTRIAKSLQQPLDTVNTLIKQILRLNPKPGANYSSDTPQRVIPDIVVEDKEGEFKITINDEDIPALTINKAYGKIFKNSAIDSETKRRLKEKLHNAAELLRAINKRNNTLKKVIEVVMEIQQDVLSEGLSHLKPLTFKLVAQKLDLHESTVCRTVMNKYVQLPYGVVALKDFFSSCVHDNDGNSISSSYPKIAIKELIEQEKHKQPLSDSAITRALKQDKNINISRRTVAKYRKELKIPSSPYRREH